jgi:hypothetical protein
VFNVLLPISSEVYGFAALHGQRRYAADLLTVRHTAVVFSPRAFLSIAEKIASCNMMGNAQRLVQFFSE